MTTKIRLMSDLHLEFRNNLFDHIWTPEETDKEQILLLAGDISTGMGAKTFIEEACKSFRQVIYISGNHEYYDQDFEKTVKDWQDWELEGAPKNFHFLYNDWRILDGVRFIGGTMWTSFSKGDPIVMGAAHRMMNDYNKIRSSGMPITPHFILREHDRFMDFLKTMLDKKFDGPTVVMTHHSPGNELKRKGYLGDRLGSCYFADIEELIGHYDCVKLFCHGHTHQNWDYMINNTRVVCNPYGYWNYSTNKGFDDGLVVEV